MAIGNSDGSIVLKTKIDDSGIKSGMKKMSLDTSKQSFSLTKQYASLAKQGKGASEEAQNIAKQIFELGGVSIGAGAALGGVGIAIDAVITVATAAISVIADLTRKLIDFSKEASEVAIQQEASVQRLVDIYGTSSRVVGDFIDQNANSLGMSKASAASFASVYGNLFDAWADQATNAELTNRYLQMTAVVASNAGRTVEDVQERIRSGLLGNTEAIEDLGIFVNVNTIKMTDAFKRMANGKSWEQLDAYTQQQIRTMAILEQATGNYGDEVAKTAVLTKSKLSAAWNDFQATWGTAVNTILIPILDVVAKIVQTATLGLQTILGYSGGILEGAGEISDKASETVDSQDDLTQSMKETANAQKKLLAGFDEINILSASNSEGAGGGVLDLGLSGSDNKTVKELDAFSKRCVKILEPLKEAFGTLFDRLNDAFVKTKEEVLIPLSNWFSREFSTEVINGYATEIDDLSNSIGVLTEQIDNLGKTAIVPFLSDVITGVLNAGVVVADFITGVIDDITRNCDELLNLFYFVWNIIYPLLSTFLVGLMGVIGAILTIIVEIISAVGSLIGIVAELIFVLGSDKVEKHAERLLLNIANVGIAILNIVIAVLNTLWSVIYATGGAVVNAVGGLFEAAAQIAGYDADLTWDATAFPKIPYVPKLDIPALAQGAVIPPNKEFLAILGDQTSGTNIEAPLQTIVDAFNIALQNNPNAGRGSTEVVLAIDGREFGRAVVAQGNRENRRIGTRLVVV